MAATFDVSQARTRFPGLNQPIVLLDNAGIVPTLTQERETCIISTDMQVK